MDYYSRLILLLLHSFLSGETSELSMEQPQQSSEEASVVTGPNTPSSAGHVTPVNQSASGTAVNLSASRSPLDFNKHLQYIRQVAVSPGEGFTYTGRSMYGNNNQVKYCLLRDVMVSYVFFGNF